MARVVRYGPDDVYGPVAVASLASAAPYTEVPFKGEGLVVAGGAYSGAFCSVLGGDRWSPLGGNRRFRKTNDTVVYLKQAAIVTGQLSLEFFERMRGQSWEDVEADVRALLGDATSTAAPGGNSPKSSATATTFSGPTVALAAGVQIVSNAPADLVVYVSGDQNNANGAFVAATQAAAALLGTAGGGSPVYGAGFRPFLVRKGGNLWVASSAGSATVYTDYES